MNIISRREEWKLRKKSIKTKREMLNCSRMNGRKSISMKRYNNISVVEEKERLSLELYTCGPPLHSLFFTAPLPNSHIHSFTIKPFPPIPQHRTIHHQLSLSLFCYFYCEWVNNSWIILLPGARCRTSKVFPAEFSVRTSSLLGECWEKVLVFFRFFFPGWGKSFTSTRGGRRKFETYRHRRVCQSFFLT